MSIPAPLVFADTETTSLNRRTRQAWDVALIRRDHLLGGAVRETTVQFFVDVDLADADPMALRIGGFYDRHPVGQWLLAQTPGRRPRPSAQLRSDWNPHVWFPPGTMLSQDVAAAAIVKLTHGAHLVGAIPSFDEETFDRLVHAHGLAGGWHYHLIDVEAMMVGWLAGKGVRIDAPWKSDSLASLVMDVLRDERGETPDLILPEKARHTALGDANWARLLYDTLTGIQS